MLLVLCCMGSFAQNKADVLYEQAGKYCEEAEYAAAIDAYRKAAKKGSTDAMAELGDMYYYGIGVDENNDEAFKWYTQAAKHNNEKGIRQLANCYQCGYGTERNLNEAIRLLTILGNKGNVDAMRSLAYIYRSSMKEFSAPSDTVSYDEDFEAAFPEESFMWMRKAADAGDYDSMLEVGSCYEKGFGVKQSYDEAVRWYEQVAQTGNIDAYQKIADLYFNRGQEDKTEEWLKRSYEVDERMAQYLLAGLYAKQGRNHEAIRLFKELADDEDDPHYSAASDLAEIYKKLGLTDEAIKYLLLCEDYSSISRIYIAEGRLDEAEALLKLQHECGNIGCSELADFYISNGKIDEGHDLLLKFANEGDPDAMLNLGFYYKGYLGFPKNLSESKRWLTLAMEAGSDLAEYLLMEEDEETAEEEETDYLSKAENGDTEAMIKVAAELMVNDESTQIAEGLAWLEKAFEAGSNDAGFILSSLYYLGDMVEKDIDKCLQIIEKMSEGGDQNAKAILAMICLERNEGGDWQKAEKCMAELMADNNDAVGVATTLAEQYIRFPDFAKSRAAEFERLLSIIKSKGDADDFYALGAYYKEAANYAEAFKWFKLAVERGSYSSIPELGNCYFYGRGVAKDYEQAVRLYEQQAPYQSYEYAFCLYHGYGVEANPYKAISMLKELANDENENAQAMLKELGVRF